MPTKVDLTRVRRTFYGTPPMARWAKNGGTSRLSPVYRGEIKSLGHPPKGERAWLGLPEFFTLSRLNWRVDCTFRE